MEAMDTYCCPVRDKIRGQHIMSKGYCIKSWALPGREEAHGTSSTNGTGLCCILQWQHLAHPPSAPLQPAELLLFYTMKLEAGKGQGKKNVLLLCSLSTVFPGQFCHTQPVLFTHPSSPTISCSQFVPQRLSHSLLRTIHANNFSCWLTYAKRRTLTSWNIFPLGILALLCHVTLYPPCLLHHLRSGSSSMLWWDSAFLPLLHSYMFKRKVSE